MTTELDPGVMTNFIQFLQYVNGLGGGWMINGFTFVVLIVTYSWGGVNHSDRFLTSTLITAILSTLLSTVQLLNMWFMVFYWVLASLAVFTRIWSSD